jgi:hypothetical protein
MDNQEHTPIVMSPPIDMAYLRAASRLIVKQLNSEINKRRKAEHDKRKAKRKFARASRKRNRRK